MKNTGTTTWTRAREYKLGTENPQDNTLWIGGTRVYLAANESIAPGQSKTFSFEISAPTKAGTYDFQWRMVQDGVEWFGDKTPNKRITVKAAANGAQFVSQSVPQQLQPGEKKTVAITMKNTGATTWTQAGQYKLGTQNPQDNTLWIGGTRVYLAANETIAPGQSKTFSFEITAPKTAGTYNFQWRMVQDGVGWFGDFTANVPIKVEAQSANAAEFVSQSVPQLLSPGEKTAVSITLKNVGATTWTQAGQYKLGTENPQDNTLWIGGTRVYLAANESIASGQSKTFSFEITAPKTPGTYNFQWRMVQDGVGWFGDHTPNMQIIVPEKIINIAQFISQSFPDRMQPGEKKTVSITMKNTGSTTWTQAGQYKLGSHQDNPIWTGDTRVYLSPNEAVKPGQTKTFTFDITVPTRAGTYSFQWRMVQDGVGWFGDLTSEEKITIDPLTFGPIFPIRPGLWPASEEESSTDDLDGDGIPQIRELQLAQAFFPTIWYDRGEKYTAPGGNGKRGNPNQPGRLVFRVRPHPQKQDYLAITYALLYNRDGGETGINAHPGDVEPFAITLAPKTDCALGYGILFIRTWAHEGTSAEHVDTDLLSSRCNYGFTANPVGREDVVLVSENKHGNYLSEWNCDWGLNTFGAENCDRDFTLGDVNAWVGFNAGEPGAPRHRDLGELGFPGEEMWARKKFCGGATPRNGCPGPVEEKFELYAPTDERFRDARFISQSVPAELKAGETKLVSITMKNSGSTIWNRENDYKLGALNPPNNTVWTINPWIYLGAGTSQVFPGGIEQFTFTITAPSTLGAYNFQWRMLQKNSEWFGDFTPNVAIQVKPTTDNPPAFTWEDDKFDGLTAGPLNGKNGWVLAAADRASAIVKSSDGGGNLLEIDPGTNATIVMNKNVPAQANGLHSLSLRVRVTDATEASLARIEVNTDPNTGWTKKFQVYIGNSMRVNHAKTGETVTFVSATQMGRWYALRFDMDLDKGLLEVWVDGSLAADNLKMHPGPILFLSLSGWDRAGAVSIDDLLGIRR
jgi:uncharacterized membrane protein